MSTLLNVAAGYFIEYASWIFVFIIFGGLLIVSTLFVVFCIIDDLDNNMNDNNTDANDDANDVNDDDEYKDVDQVPIELESRMEYTVRDILTDWRSVIILFVSFWMTFRSRSIYIIISSLWMENVFDLSASTVGWTNVSIIIGEALAPVFGNHYLKRLPLKRSAIETLLSQLFTTVGLMLILSSIFGNNCGSIVIVLIILVLLTFTHQSFYIVQQSNAIEFAKNQQYALMLLLGERMCQETGSIVSLLVTSRLWYYDFENSVMIFSIVWSVSTVIMFGIVCIYP